MSLPLPKSQLDSYWQALSANPVVQTLDGHGVNAKFEAAPAARAAIAAPRLRNDFNL